MTGAPVSNRIQKNPDRGDAIYVAEPTSFDPEAGRRVTQEVLVAAGRWALDEATSLDDVDSLVSQAAQALGLSSDETSYMEMYDAGEVDALSIDRSYVGSGPDVDVCLMLIEAKYGSGRNVDYDLLSEAISLARSRPPAPSVARAY